MPDNVVSLDEHRPHLSGKARCLNTDCRFEWEAVAPIGARWLECPSCSLERGRFLAQVERPGSHWHCVCGCDLFYCTDTGFYCPNCGLWQTR